MLTGWSVLGLFLAVFVAVYAPVVMTSYAFFDDYNNLADGPQGGTLIIMLREGRPLLALYTRFFLHMATDIADLRYVRFVGIAGIAVLAWSVFRVLVRTGWGQIQAFCVGVVVGTSLPFQVYTAWSIASFNVFAALASGWAFSLAERAFHQPRPQWLPGAMASLALLVGLMIHQAAAMFFWVFVAVVVLKPNASLGDVLRRFGWYGLIASVGMLCGFGMYTLGLAWYRPDVPARAGLVQDIPDKVGWFLVEPLPNALNFALLSPAHWLLSDGSPVLSSFHRDVDVLIAWGILVLIAGGLLLHVRGTLRERLGKLAIALSLLPLSYAPNLLITENFATYRTLPGLSCVVIVCAFFACRGYARYFWRPLSPVWTNVVMGSVALAGGLLALYRVQTYFVAPQVQELEIMRSQLAQGNVAEANGVYLIRPRWQETLAPLTRYDEFGSPSSTTRPWIARHMVTVLLRTLAPDHAHLPVTTIAADAPVEPPPNSLIVDMRNLRLQAHHDDL